MPVLTPVPRSRPLRALPAAAAALALLAACAPVLAHPLEAGAAVQWPPWAWEPAVLLPLLASGAAYALGVRRAWAAVGRGRGVALPQVAAFGGGWLALAVALLSPLDGLGTLLFSAHMLQHELLMVVAAPLLCIARPLVAWLWLLPPAGRRRVVQALRRRAWARTWGWLTSAPVGWSLHAAVLWGWHVPRWFEAALRHPALHVLQHLAFLASALLFWWAALGPLTRAARGGALLYLFTTMLHTGALGALLALSPQLWYPLYGERAAGLGIDGLEDQQLGGLVMWVPAGLAYFAAGLALAARWAGLGGGGQRLRGIRMHPRRGAQEP